MGPGSHPRGHWLRLLTGFRPAAEPGPPGALPEVAEARAALVGMADWDAGPGPGAGGEIQAVRAAVRQALAEAVAAGAVHVALSGGLDSVLLLTLLAGMSAPVRAVIAAWPGGPAGEPEAALEVAHALGVAAETVTIGAADLPGFMGEAVRAAGSPIYNRAGVERVMFWRECARRGITAVISGVGADEIFCGDPGLHLRAVGGVPAVLAQYHAQWRLAAALFQRGFSPPPWRPEAPLPTGFTGARAALLRYVLPQLVWPIESVAAGAYGVRLLHPFLHAGVVRAALRLPAAALAVADLGKLPLRAWALELGGSRTIALRPKVPRYASSVLAGTPEPAWRDLWHSTIGGGFFATYPEFDAGAVGRFAAGIAGPREPMVAVVAADRVALQLLSLGYLAGVA